MGMVVMICAICDRDPCPTPTFCAACHKADAARKPEGAAILRLRRLMDLTFEQANREINGKNRAAASTVEALMLGLRDGGKALSVPARRRLSELSEQQLHEVCVRLQKITRAWTPDGIATLVDKWDGRHG
jgi:hypothetical protein